MSENLNLGVNGGGIRPPSQINEERIREIAETNEKVQKIYKLAKKEGFSVETEVKEHLTALYIITLRKEKPNREITIAFNVYTTKEVDIDHIVCYTNGFKYSWLKEGEFVLYRIKEDFSHEIVLAMKLRRQNLFTLAIDLVKRHYFYLDYHNKFVVV